MIKTLIKKYVGSYAKLFVIALVVICANSDNANSQITEGNFEGVVDAITDGLPGVTYTGGRYDSLPEGSDSKYEYTNNDGEISLETYYTYRGNVDFGEYVNTSGNNIINVFDMTGEFDAGIGLGCNGLDLGLEALFEFDAGDILEYLPQYILTNLATEALAQIYATPLISTVMDGLKSMQNFFSEFKQASCDMNKVMTRKDEIVKARYQECIDTASKGGIDAPENYCSEPSKLEEKIKSFQKWVKNRKSSSQSLVDILRVPYQTEADPDNPEGRVLSKGRIVAMFIPDITFTLNDGAQTRQNTAQVASIPLDDLNERMYRSSHNVIQDTYYGVITSLQLSKALNKDTASSVIEKINNYKNIMMSYGGREAFTDSSSKNIAPYSTEGIKTIEDEFKKFSAQSYKIAEGAPRLFKIGPPTGISKNGIQEDETDLIGHAAGMLDAVNECFVKTYETTGSNKYKWTKVHKNVEAIDSLIIKGGTSTDVNDIIKRIATCKSIDEVDLTLLYSHDVLPAKGQIFSLYLDKIAAESAYAATVLVAEFTKDGLMEAVNKSKSYLLTQCQTEGLDSLPRRAVSDDGSTGQAYESCEQYAEQESPTEEMMKAWGWEADKLDTKLKRLKENTERANRRYIDAGRARQMQLGIPLS